MRYIDSFRDGDRVSDVYLCKSKSIALTKTGKEYANVMLADKTGRVLIILPIIMDIKGTDK